MVDYQVKSDAWLKLVEDVSVPQCRPVSGIRETKQNFVVNVLQIIKSAQILFLAVQQV